MFTSIESGFYLEVINTLVLIATAYVVWKYTQETQKIRIANTEQTNDFKKQLELFKQSNAPVFVRLGREINSKESVRFGIKNVGGTAKNLRVICEVVDNCRITPTCIEREQQGHLYLKSNTEVPEEGKLTIEFEDLFGNQYSQRFTYSRTGEPLQELRIAV